MNTDKYHEQFTIIGLNIKYYRLKKGLTQKQLSEKIHISNQQISRIESINNMASTTLYTLFTIAEALEIEPYKLLIPIDNS